MQLNKTEPSPIIINGLFIIPVIELSEKYNFNNEEMEHIKTQKVILNKHNYVSEKSYILNHEKMKNIYRKRDQVLYRRNIMSFK
jgi:hypothetical protein